MEQRLKQLAEEARAGGPRSLRAAARLMTIATDQPQRLGEMLAYCRDWPQPRLVLGVTGAPGSGKSTLVDHIVAELRTRYPDRRVGVVAVDPSSPFTGGSLLGDRVRMMRHATDSGVFIRSLASRGRLGGLAVGAKAVVRVMGLVGCDAVVVETVGVGQSEIEIAQNADLTVVVLAPGQGDSIQMLKAGLIEAGDLFVVNKADREEASRLHQQLLAMLHLEGRARAAAQHGVPGAKFASECEAVEGQAVHGHARPVFLCSAVNHQGIAALVDELEARTASNAEQWLAKRRHQEASEIRQALIYEIERRIERFLGTPADNDGRLHRVVRGETSISDMADELLREAAGGAVRSNGRAPSEKPDRGAKLSPNE